MWGSSSRPLPLTLDMGWLLLTAAPEIGLGVAPLTCSCIVTATFPLASGHHQMVKTKIRLIILFAAKDGEALYIQQKQNWKLTVAPIMNSLMSNSDLNERK